MIQDCVTCGQRTILARYIDNHLILMDSEPTPDGKAILRGDLNGQPTALFGVDSEDDAAFWGIPLDSDRYDEHRCPTEASR